MFIVASSGALVVVHQGALVFLVLRERPGREAAGCGEPHIWSMAYAASGCKRGRRKKLGVGDAGALIGERGARSIGGLARRGDWRARRKGGREALCGEEASVVGRGEAEGLAEASRPIGAKRAASLRLACQRRGAAKAVWRARRSGGVGGSALLSPTRAPLCTPGPA